MKNNNSENGYLFSKKGFYITAVIGIFAVLAAVVTLRVTTKKVKSDLTSMLSENTVPFSSEVQNDVSGVPDTRNFTKPDDLTETTKKPKETTTQKATAEKTTAPASGETAPAVKIENSAYRLPMESDIEKDYSPETPVLSKTMGDYRTHAGIDFEGSEGAAVYSVGNGKVSRVLADTMWGYIIEIDHGDFTARYVGLSQDGSVGIGQNVTLGQKIGVLSSIPAENEDGFHLHFEVIKDGKTVEPFGALGLSK